MFPPFTDVDLAAGVDSFSTRLGNSQMAFFLNRGEIDDPLVICARYETFATSLNFPVIGVVFIPMVMRRRERCTVLSNFRPFQLAVVNIRRVFLLESKMGGQKLKQTIRRAAILATIGIASYQVPSQSTLADDLGRMTIRVTDEASDIPRVSEHPLSEVQPASYSALSHAHQPASACCTVAESCGPTECCTPWWAHRTGGFGEVLYLSAGNSDLIYAVEQTGPVAAASPTGPTGISNIGEHVGYRVGFSLAQNDCCSLNASFARWDGQTTSVLNATGTNVLNSLVIHPSTATTGAASLQSKAIQSATFQFADVSLRKVYKASNAGVLNWNAGLRYGNMEQGLSADQIVSVATGRTNVNTDIDFNGFGILGGLDGTRYSHDTGLLVYGKALGSLLAGKWVADYRQTNQFGGGVIANHYDDFRVSPVIDTEIGVGWQNCSGRLRLTTGYLFSTWFNTVTTRDYIHSVRTANLLNLDDNLSFSGLTAKIDYRF